MKIFISIFAFFILYSCQKNFIVFEEDEFSISFPQNLTLDTTGLGGTKLILIADKDDDTDIFKENINLVIKKETKAINFEEFVQQTTNEAKSYGELIEYKRLKINDSEYLRLVTRIEQKGYLFKTIQHLYIKDDTVYILTFCCESKVFEKYYKEMNRVMMSFHLK